jgi:hypothetical protein
VDHPVNKNSHAERRAVRLFDEALGRVDPCPEGHQDPDPQRLTPTPNVEIGAVLIQGLNSTSDPDDQEHFHFGSIVSLLDQLNIPHVIFSYNGAENLHYRPWNTRVNIASTAEKLTPFVETAFPDGEVFIIAHSQGGSLASFWTNNHASPTALDRLLGVFFLASPLLLPIHPGLWLDPEQPRLRYWLDVIDGYSMHLPVLVGNLDGRLVVIRPWGDPLARSRFSSFLDLQRRQAPLSETIISDTGHIEICDDLLTLEIIATHIRSWTQTSRISVTTLLPGNGK